MNLSHLLPARSDIQGALEHSYNLLIDVPAPDPSPLPTPDHWAIQGSLVVGPILWLAKTYIAPELLDWIANPPSQAQAEAIYKRLNGDSPMRPDLDNVRRRLQPYLSQETPTTVTLLTWLPGALDNAPDPVAASA